ncbi:MAG: hypothetical protein KAH23_03145 [Kiritimatiellae bacterium]|nr:hypothetical protein [Kiritimatiellia bacterium]
MINCSLIFIGAFIMLFSIVKSRRILNAVSLIPKELRDSIRQLLDLHRLLMCLFLIGYVVVLVGFAFQLIILSNFLVSVIFLLGAIFVFMGIAIEVHLLSEIQNTLSGLLQICAKCKKIREPEPDENGAESWKHIEAYISARSDIDFSHGYCPDCYDDTIKQMDAKAE